MRYFLALDKGKFRNINERYDLLDLSGISLELVKDNNLRAITKFTCSFNTKFEFKHFLIEKGVLNPKVSHYEIVIFYEKTYKKSLEVAYKCDEEYFDISRLSSIIKDKCKSETFLNTLLCNYHNYKFLSEELRLIRGYVNDPFASHKFYEAVRRFINKLCYRTNSKNVIVLDFRALYDLGLFVSKLSNSGRSNLINRNSINESNNLIVREEMNDVMAFELEQLHDRIKRNEDEDGQLRMF